MRAPHLPLPSDTLIACVGISLLLTTACTTWRPIESDELSWPSAPSRVRVIRPDRTAVVLGAPYVTGDTIGGMVDGVRQEVLLSPGTTMEARTLAPVRTAALIGGLVVAAAVTYVVTEPRGSKQCGGICPSPFALAGSAICCNNPLGP
jgi:hypothetical protein